MVQCEEIELRSDGDAISYLYLKTGIAIVLYCTTVSLIPLYSKVVFSGGFGVPSFQYPITAAWLQLGFASLCVGVAAITMRPLGLSQGSWLLGPHFWYKVAYAAPAGLAFGLKYSVTNWAIQVAPSNMFVLLGSTDLIWLLILARVINKERMGLLELLSVVVCCSGISIVLIYRFHNVEFARMGFAEIFPNLLSPFIGALCITTLRFGLKGLFNPRNRLHGSTTKIEFTAIKLAVAAAAAFITSMMFENGVVHITNTEEKLPLAWWVALRHYPAEGTMLVCVSGILTFIFHVNLAWLCSLTSATAVGIMQEVKVLPQYGLNALFTALGVAGLQVDVAPMNIAGSAVALFGAGLYVCASHVSHTKGKLVLVSGGFKFLKERDGMVSYESFRTANGTSLLSPLSFLCFLVAHLQNTNTKGIEKDLREQLLRAEP
jgi:hypothetical protein